jgi:hypothetical protein
MDKDMFLVLYKSIVRPLLEYCTPVWSPYLKKDVRKIESIQRRATKLILIVVTSLFSKFQMMPPSLVS